MANKKDRHRAEIGTDLAAFLKKWLIDHIGGTDQKYVPHLKDHGY